LRARSRADFARFLINLICAARADFARSLINLVDHTTFDMPPKALSLTYVQYEDTPLDLAFALCTFVPFVIAICQVSCVFINRCLEATFAFLGLVVSTGINAVLKSIIKEPRPEGSHRHDYGMPSDHSQFMAFASVYLLAWFYHSGRVRAMRSDLKSLFSFIAVFAVRDLSFA
jgi:membrane-associated phospholipid phosphatase